MTFLSKEIKLSLFIDDRTVYIENPKASAKIFLKLISDCRWVARCKVKTKKSIAFLYIINKR